jgi:uncharacterized tellurite resistance protein B-like protein
MFERFTSFLEQLGAKTPVRDGTNPEQVAAAALLFTVMDADGVRHENEIARLSLLLSERFGIEGDALESLIKRGEQAERESVDLFQFTSLLVKLDESERLSLIELIWEVVYADDEVHELEDNLVWRIAELIGVSSRDRMLLKQKVAKSAED